MAIWQYEQCSYNKVPMTAQCKCYGYKKRQKDSTNKVLVKVLCQCYGYKKWMNNYVDIIN